jgi:hypothetical protein
MALKIKKGKTTKKVYDKDGVEHTMETNNAFDKVRLDGWSFKNPATKPAPAEPDPVTGILPTIEGNTEEGPPPTELDNLRAEASRLGIIVETNWGMKRLRKEIDAFKKDVA